MPESIYPELVKTVLDMKYPFSIQHVCGKLERQGESVDSAEVEHCLKQLAESHVLITNDDQTFKLDPHIHI